MSVKRWDMSCSVHDAQEFDCGRFVEHSDYAALEAEKYILEVGRQESEDELALLRKAYAELESNYSNCHKAFELGSHDHAKLHAEHKALRASLELEARYARVVAALKLWWQDYVDNEGDGPDALANAMIDLGFLEKLPDPAIGGYRWAEGEK